MKKLKDIPTDENGWIDVDDATPDECGIYVDKILIYCEPPVSEGCIGYYDKDFSNPWMNNDDNPLKPVSHWKPFKRPDVYGG